VDGKPYSSERYSFDFGSTSGRKGKQRVVDQYPRGAQRTCYVNPDDPSEAVINRDFVPTMLFGLFPLIFVAVGGIGLLFVTGRVRIGSGRRGKVSKTEWLPDDVQSKVERGLQRGYVEDFAPGPVTLKPRFSPWGKLGAALFFGIIWNGITSVFVTIAVRSHLKGDPEWFLTIFIIPFVLVGLGVIVYVCYAVLALFTPQPTVTISARAVRLGDSVRLNWLFSGSAHSLRQLKITVVGQEQATYRRGTKTHTDTEDFLEVPVVDTSHFLEIQRGEGEVKIPPDTMHSFQSSHNKISWSIRLKGEIAMWPDVDNSYPLTVIPKGVNLRSGS
jgi:hypothetical protein